MFISLQAFSFGHLLINFMECSFFGLFICLSWVQQSCVQTFVNNFDLNHTLESDCDDSLSLSWSSWREWSHCLFKIIIICPPLGPWNCTAVPLKSWEATSLPGTRCCGSLQIYPGLIIFPFISLLEHETYWPFQPTSGFVMTWRTIHTQGFRDDFWRHLSPQRNSFFISPCSVLFESAISMVYNFICPFFPLIN